MSSFKPCSKCDHSVDHALPNGFILTRDGSAVECSCHKAWRKQNKIEHLLKNANLPLECIESKADLDKSLYDKVASKKLVYIYGPNGTGKTTAAVKVLEKFCKDNVKTVLYVSMQTLSEQLFSFDFDATIYDKIDLLAIDECFDAEKMRLYSNAKLNQISQIEMFLRRRVQQSEKKTILISNVQPTGIGKAFTSSCQNFICRELEAYGSLVCMSKAFMSNFPSIEQQESSQNAMLISNLVNGDFTN